MPNLSDLAQDFGGDNMQPSYAGGNFSDIGAGVADQGQPATNGPTYDNANQMGDNALSLVNERGQQFRLGAQGPPITKFEVNYAADGTSQYKAHFSQAAYEHMQEMMGIAQQAIKARDAQIAEIQKKKDLIDQNPIIAQVGRLASLAAGQYFAPGARGAALVRGAGLFGGEAFGKTSEQLAGEIADLQQEKYGISANESSRLAEDERARAAEERAAAAEKRNELVQANEDARQLRIERDTVLSRWQNIASKGQWSDTMEANAKKQMLDAGWSLDDTNQNINTIKQQSIGAVEEGGRLMPFKDNNGKEWTIKYDKAGKEVSRTYVGQGEKSAEAQRQDQDQREAEGLAAMLSSPDPAQFSNGYDFMRSRAAPVALRAMQLADQKSLLATGKHFSEQEMRNKAAVSADFAPSGETGKSLGLMDRFYQHGGDLSDAIDRFNQRYPEAVGKTVNYLKEHFGDDPDLQRVVSAAKPFADEFERTFKSGTMNAALTDQDVKAQGVLVNPAMPLDRIKASINQMGMSVGDVYKAQDHRYQRSFPGYSIKDAFSPDAKAGAQKIGVSIGGAASQPTGPQLTPQEQAILNGPGSPDEKRIKRQALPRSQRSDVQGGASGSF